MKYGLLQTKPYSKPCDDHTFLIPSSCHPTHCIRNIPYSTAIRIYKIASESNEYLKTKSEFSTYFKARGYSIGVIEEAFSKVESKERKVYYQVKEPGKELHSKDEKTYRVIPLVADFNPGLPNIGRILNSHKHILRMDAELCKAINPDGIFASFRGAKTIHDMLVHSRLKPTNGNHSLETKQSEDDPIGSCKSCRSKCDLCKNFLK